MAPPVGSTVPVAALPPRWWVGERNGKGWLPMMHALDLLFLLLVAFGSVAFVLHALWASAVKALAFAVTFSGCMRWVPLRELERA
jgi:hypothetical protein